MSIIKQVAAAGDDGAFETSAGGGHPKTQVTFTSVRIE